MLPLSLNPKLITESPCALNFLNQVRLRGGPGTASSNPDEKKKKGISNGVTLYPHLLPSIAKSLLKA